MQDLTQIGTSQVSYLIDGGTHTSAHSRDFSLEVMVAHLRLRFCGTNPFTVFRLAIRNSREIKRPIMQSTKAPERLSRLLDGYRERPSPADVVPPAPWYRRTHVRANEASGHLESAFCRVPRLEKRPRILRTHCNRTPGSTTMISKDTASEITRRGFLNG